VTAQPQPAGSSRPVLSAEFLVIGGGVTGLAAAWSLTRRGREVVVLDQAPVGHSRGGSHGSCRIFRLGYDDPGYVTLAGQARALWSELEDACGERLLLPTPQLTFGPQMPQVHAAMRAAGAACEMLTAASAAARFPGVCVAGEVLLEPGSAVIAADRTLAGLAGLAGEIRTGVRVTALADDGRRVRVSTPAAEMSRPAGSSSVPVPGRQACWPRPGSPCQPRRRSSRSLTSFRPITAPGHSPCQFSCNLAATYRTGCPCRARNATRSESITAVRRLNPIIKRTIAAPGLVRRIEQVAREFLPRFDPSPVALERCVYDNSPDADFIVDRTGNVVIGSGTSGHGFKFGPLLGEWLASLADDTAGDGRTWSGALAALADRFALTRF